MDITITIPTDKKDRILDGLCYQNAYQDNIPDPENEGQTIPNPESKAVYAKRMVMQYIKNNVIAYEATRDIEVAKKAAIDKASADISLS